MAPWGDHTPRILKTSTEVWMNVTSPFVSMDKSELTVIKNLFVIFWMSDERPEISKLWKVWIVSDVYYSAERFQSINHKHTVR